MNPLEIARHDGVSSAVHPDVQFEYVGCHRRGFERFGPRSQNATGENRVTADVCTDVDEEITFAQQVYLERHLLEFAWPVIDIGSYPFNPGVA